MAEACTITEADILSEVVAPDQPGLSIEFAHALLQLRFAAKASRRIGKLLEKNNRGTIKPGERAELDKYLRVGQILDLLQAKARLCIDRSSVEYTARG